MVPDAFTGGPRFAAFSEHYVRHTKGRWACSPLLLEEWQRHILWDVLEVDPVTDPRVSATLCRVLIRTEAEARRSAATR